MYSNNSATKCSNEKTLMERMQLVEFYRMQRVKDLNGKKQSQTKIVMDYLNECT